MTRPSLKMIHPRLSDGIHGISRWLSVEMSARPRTLYIEVTLRCNAKCDFCSYWKQPKMKELKEYQSVVKKIKPLSVIITGGEPLVRKDLGQIIDGIKRERPLIISLLTNGYLLNIQKAGELLESGLDTISISLNHIGVAQDDERHINGLFAHLSKVVPDLSGMGFKRINLNTVFLNSNLDEIVDIVRLAEKWGVGVSFSSYSSSKADNHSYKIAENDLKKLEVLLRKLQDLKKNGAPIENSNWYLERILEFYRTGRVKGKCGAGKKTIHVTPNGYLKPCPDFPAEIHYNSYQPDWIETISSCDRCWYACRGEVEAPVTPQRALYFLRMWRKGTNVHLANPVEESNGNLKNCSFSKH